jgi:hypothetical protein
VTDVDTDKQRAIDLRSSLEEIMKSHPDLSLYSSFYVKPEDQAKMSPEEIEMMRMYSGLQDSARAYAKEKREKIGLKAH